jgi:hypothetical protein
LCLRPYFLSCTFLSAFISPCISFCPSSFLCSCLRSRNQASS